MLYIYTIFQISSWGERPLALEESELHLVFVMTGSFLICQLADGDKWGFNAVKTEIALYKITESPSRIVSLHRLDHRTYADGPSRSLFNLTNVHYHYPPY